MSHGIGMQLLSAGPPPQSHCERDPPHRGSHYASCPQLQQTNTNNDSANRCSMRTKQN
jgi:hypothetical protein